MIEKLIAWSARNKFIVLIVVAAAIVGAFYCVKNSRLDAIPD